MLYEIINPSDPYTIEAHSLDVAMAACVFLGHGQYAFKPLEESGETIPIMMFGNADSWCQEHLKCSLEAAVDRVTTDTDKRSEMAECLDSCLIGHKDDRDEYRAELELIEPDKREAWRVKWHTAHCSSMNDIGSRARKMAAKFREGAKNPLVQAPRQVFSV